MTDSFHPNLKISTCLRASGKTTFYLRFSVIPVTRPILHGNVVLGWLVALLDFSRREI
jgi:hypothetical protein